MNFKMRLAITALLTIGVSLTAAHADTITFTLTEPNQFLNFTGGTLTFDATVFAPASNSGAVFLNGDSFNVTGPVTLDDTDFFADFPLSLAPGTGFTGDLFTLTMPANALRGTYPGTFSLLGGANASAGNTLGAVNFTVTVPTPEPSSTLLLLTGMAGLGMVLLHARLKGRPFGWARWRLGRATLG